MKTSEVASWSPAVVAKAHRPSMGVGTSPPWPPGRARPCRILVAHILLVQRHEKIIAGGLSSSSASAASRLRPCIGVMQ